MKFRTIVGLLIVLFVCSCAQKPSEKVDQIEDDPNQHLDLSNKLKIENRVNRGARYTDSDSIDYWLIHIASTITNESTIPIQLELAFSNEYEYPTEYGNQKFKVFILPDVFAVGGVSIIAENPFLTDSMQVEIRDYLKNGIDSPYRIKKIIQAGESVVVSIGTQYAVSFSCAVFPNLLLLQSDFANFSACENLFVHNESSAAQLALGLKLDFRPVKTVEKCTIIQCGQISYTD